MESTGRGSARARLAQLQVAELPISRDLYLALERLGINRLGELLEARRRGLLDGLARSQREQLETALEPYVDLWRRAYPGVDFFSRSLLNRPRAMARGRGRRRLLRRTRSNEDGATRLEESPPDVPAMAVDPAESIAARALTDGEAELLRGTPIEELGLSVRAKRLPGRLGWRTALDVAAAPALVVLNVKNCGRRTVAELRSTVSKTLEMQASGEPEVSIEPQAVQRFVDEMAGSLGEKADFVVRERFGLWDGARETLEDIG